MMVFNVPFFVKKIFMLKFWLINSSLRTPFQFKDLEFHGCVVLSGYRVLYFHCFLKLFFIIVKRYGKTRMWGLFCA